MNHDHLYKKRWENESPFVLLLAPLIAGLLFQHLFPAINGWLWCACSVLLLLFAIVINLYRSPVRNIYLLRLVSIGLTVFFFGCSAGYFGDIRNNDQWYGHCLHKGTAIAGRVYDAPQLKARSILLPVSAEYIRINEQWQPVRGNFKLYVYRSDSLPDYQLNDRVVIPQQLIAIRNSGNPYSFDYAGYAAHNNLFHQAFISGKDVFRIPGSGISSNPVASLRNILTDQIRHNVPDSTTAALTEAMLLNERTMLNDELWQAYSVTGIVHIIAISGAHVAMFCNVILFLLFFLKSRRWNFLKYSLAIAFVWFYIMITGYPPSAVRAALMFILYAFGIMVNRAHRSVNTWAATGFLLLCVCPGWLYDVGFQLSFLAVLSIMLFYRKFYRIWIPQQILLRLLWQTLSVSIAAQIMVFPLVIYYFHQFPVWALAANIPAALFSEILMVGALLLFSLSVFGSCLWLGKILIWVTDYFHKLIGWMAHYSPESFRSLYIDATDYWLLMLTIVLLCLYFFRRKTGYLFSGLSLGCLLLLSFILQDIQALRREKIIVYNVSRLSLVEVYKGKSAVLYGADEDTLDKKIAGYNLLPARLGHRAHLLKTDHIQTNYIGEIDGKRILWLNEAFVAKPGSSFPVDYLIVSAKTTFDPEMWQRVFHPSLIVIDGSLPLWKGKQWKDTLTHYGVRVHWVGEDNAWTWGH